MGDNPYTAPIDEDKLVQLLVDALCKKGDEYAKSVDVSKVFRLQDIKIGRPLKPGISEKYENLPFHPLLLKK